MSNGKYAAVDYSTLENTRLIWLSSKPSSSSVSCLLFVNSWYFQWKIIYHHTFERLGTGAWWGKNNFLMNASFLEKDRTLTGLSRPASRDKRGFLPWPPIILQNFHQNYNWSDIGLQRCSYNVGTSCTVQSRDFSFFNYMIKFFSAIFNKNRKQGLQINSSRPKRRIRKKIRCWLINCLLASVSCKLAWSPPGCDSLEKIDGRHLWCWWKQSNVIDNKTT